jgi:hypothetical protein
VSRAVLDVLHVALELLYAHQNHLCDIDVRVLVLRTYVGDISSTAFLEHEVDGTVVVLDVEPIADVRALAVYRSGFIVLTILTVHIRKRKLLRSPKRLLISLV